MSKKNLVTSSLIAIPLLAGVTYFSLNASTDVDQEKSQPKQEEKVQREPGQPVSSRFRPIVLNPDYEHNKWGIAETSDLILNFAAYTTCFDTEDDDNGDGKPDYLGVPEWVAFEIKKLEGEMPKYNRPSKWITDDLLFADNMAPNDDTYAVSRGDEMKIVSGNSRFVRGHMCPKNSADRLGENAGYNTHTVLNAVPQLQWQNNEVWKYLEQDCEKWANTYGRIWVIAGPAFFKKNPSMWLGQAGNTPCAIPDATYKIVIRENPASETGIECMAFLFPNILEAKYKTKDVSFFLTTVADLEKVTRQTFLTNLSSENRAIELTRNEGLSEAEKEAVFNKWVQD